MGGSCNRCQHRCCINGESGVAVSENCSGCGEWLQLCSNDLSEEQLERRCNGDACGCADNPRGIYCTKCNEEYDNFLCESCDDRNSFICLDCR